MGQKIVAIHQPTFFPWLGFFNKVARADVFLVHDNVQFPKTGGTWMNRVRILVQGHAAWLTVPVRRDYHGVQLVREVRIDERTAWRRKCLDTVRHAYARTPHFGAVYPFLEDLFARRTDGIAEFNVHAIRALLERLEMSPGAIESGARLGLEGRGTDLLVAMVKTVGGDAYLCGDGAAGYQEDEKFAAAGLRLVRQEFRQAAYGQVGAKGFVPGLSIIDALMQCGFESTRALVLGRVGQPAQAT